MIDAFLESFHQIGLLESKEKSTKTVKERVKVITETLLESKEMKDKSNRKKLVNRLVTGITNSL